ncbi:MAG TPA: primosomal protein N' [Solirubrobacteraceae bacterium]|nr:primosomal protein N' [Solirubrobacteraceae bacterium]
MSAAVARVQPLVATRALAGPFDYALPEELRSQVQVGSLLRVPFGARELTGVVVELAGSSELAEGRLRRPRALLSIALPGELIELAHYIARIYCSTFSRALALCLPPGAAAGIGLRRAPARVQASDGNGRQSEVTLQRPQLTAAQAAALAQIDERLGARRFAPLLLHGVTGSGKTEVYLRACERALAEGRSAIILVPEIALTPQIAARFRARLGDRVAVLHSALPDGERRAQWRRLREGGARVCVGPRSAVFAPLGELGLVVLDEEHDPSYKHESDPRYDARRIAAERARRSGAVLLAGSATPRAESFAHLQRLQLPERADGSPLPAVEILDMRAQRSLLHTASVEALAALRAAGGKAIVLLNRRGFSAFLACADCGHVWGCPECDVTLVLHRREGSLSCHHCGHRERAPRRCACGSASLVRHGLGTERLESELLELLGSELPVFRLDSDVLAREGRAGEVAERVLARFAQARCGVLIGTQMVAKGHDFPDVSLGLVLDADGTLRFPDFRAEERAFALIAQLAGRVGRGVRGRVLVQTLAPQARAIRHAAMHDAEGFLAAELRRRRALAYPPYAELIRVICAAQEAASAHGAAQCVRAHAEDELLAAGVAERTRLLGPAALMRLRGSERAALLVKTTALEEAVRALGAAVERAAGEHRAVAFAVDTDPR